MQVRLSIPERRPEALAAVLLDAITSARPGESASEAALRLADEAGRRLGSQAREQRKPGRLGPERALGLAEEVLAEYGFEPLRSSTTCVRLRNCPYQPLTAHAADLVCGMNQRHVAGLLRGLQAPASVTAVLAPRPPQCCVELRA
jgi:predicted ArsR family transcriptional regulator